MFLPFFNIRCVWAVSADEFLCEFVALIESFRANFDAMFEVVKFVLKNLRIFEMFIKKCQKSQLKYLKIPL